MGNQNNKITTYINNIKLVPINDQINPLTVSPPIKSGSRFFQHFYNNIENRN